MKPTDDLRVKGYRKLLEPGKLKEELALSPAARETVLAGRGAIDGILHKQDKRLLVIVGPCSIHDEKAAYEYAEKLQKLREQVKDALFVIMRVYFEKPRTSVGWKGLINDPRLDGTCDIMEGLRKARIILLKINEIGVPAATEFLETITPQYVADLVSWACIGARTTESQTHRELASGLSTAVGFKNGTDGNMSSAINGIVAAKTGQSFLGIDQNGHTCVVQTNGNPLAHIVLRGGAKAQLRSHQYRTGPVESDRKRTAGNHYGRLFTRQFDEKIPGSGKCHAECHRSAYSRQRCIDRSDDGK